MIKDEQRWVKIRHCRHDGIKFMSSDSHTALFLIAFTMLLSHFDQVKAATIKAQSASFADVSSAVASARDGDIVIVPAGTASWTSTLRMTKDITLQGQTTVVGADPSSFTVTDRTVIIDDVPRTSRARVSALIQGNFSKSQRPRITGITFKVGSDTAPNSSGSAALYFEGACPNFRIDHCSFCLLSRYNMRLRGNVFGVMDHCVAVNDSGHERFYFQHDTYGGHSFGDGSWTDDPKFGTNQAFYVEDCSFTSTFDGDAKHGSIDGDGGMRRVVRHCHFLRCVAGLHGTETSGRMRGTRMVETYLNIFDLRAGAFTGIQHRAGTGLYWGNTFKTDPSFTRGYELVAKRQQSPFRAWGGANGKNPLDSNDTEGDGTYVAKHAPHLYWSGTASATLDDSVKQNGAGWGTNHWAGYECTNNATGLNSIILSNTTDTLTLAKQWSGIGKSTFTSGETFVIYRLARASLDQPGMGKGDLVTGNPPTNTQWPNQQSEPLYSWLNTNNGSNYTKFFTLASNAPIPTIQENRDYFNWATSFDGTAGVGVGLKSARPSSCAKGVGYWATDENKFYVATGTNTWSLYYTPYIYPHPLVSGAPRPQGNIGPPPAQRLVNDKSKSLGH